MFSIDFLLKFEAAGADIAEDANCTCSGIAPQQGWHYSYVGGFVAGMAMHVRGSTHAAGMAILVVDAHVFTCI